MAIKYNVLDTSPAAIATLKYGLIVVYKLDASTVALVSYGNFETINITPTITLATAGNIIKNNCPALLLFLYPNKINIGGNNNKAICTMLNNGKLFVAGKDRKNCVASCAVNLASNSPAHKAKNIKTALERNNSGIIPNKTTKAIITISAIDIPTYYHLPT